MCQITGGPPIRARSKDSRGRTIDTSSPRGRLRRLATLDSLSGDALRRHVLLKAADRASKAFACQRTLVFDLDILCRGVKIFTPSGDFALRIWPRPHVRFFLEAMRPHFRLAVWSNSGAAWADAALAALDPYQELLPRRLLGASTTASEDMPTVLDDGAAVHPGDVLILTSDRTAFGAMSQNVIEVEPYIVTYGAERDDVLLQLTVLLVRHLAAPRHPYPDDATAGAAAEGSLPPVAGELRRLGLHATRYSACHRPDLSTDIQAGCQPFACGTDMAAVHIAAAAASTAVASDTADAGHYMDSRLQAPSCTRTHWPHLEFLELVNVGEEREQLQPTPTPARAEPVAVAAIEELWLEGPEARLPCAKPQGQQDDVCCESSQCTTAGWEFQGPRLTPSDSLQRWSPEPDPARSSSNSSSGSGSDNSALSEKLDAAGSACSARIADGRSGESAVDGCSSNPCGGAAGGVGGSQGGVGGSQGGSASAMGRSRDPFTRDTASPLAGFFGKVRRAASLMPKKHTPGAAWRAAAAAAPAPAQAPDGGLQAQRPELALSFLYKLRRSFRNRRDDAARCRGSSHGNAFCGGSATTVVQVSCRAASYPGRDPSTPQTPPTAEPYGASDSGLVVQEKDATTNGKASAAQQTGPMLGRPRSAACSRIALMCESFGLPTASAADVNKEDGDSGAYRVATSYGGGGTDSSSGCDDSSSAGNLAMDCAPVSSLMAATGMREHSPGRSRTLERCSISEPGCSRLSSPGCGGGLHVLDLVTKAPARHQPEEASALRGRAVMVVEALSAPSDLGAQVPRLPEPYNGCKGLK